MSSPKYNRQHKRIKKALTRAPRVIVLIAKDAPHWELFHILQCIPESAEAIETVLGGTAFAAVIVDRATGTRRVRAVAATGPEALAAGINETLRGLSLPGTEHWYIYEAAGEESAVQLQQLFESAPDLLVGAAALDAALAAMPAEGRA